VFPSTELPGSHPGRGRAAMNDQNRAHRIGTHAWSLCTNGRLSAAERRQLALPLVTAHVRNAMGRLAMAVRLNAGRSRTLDVTQLAPPSTILTRAAEAHARTRLGPTLLNHSRRAYAFGAALGAIDRIDVDRELLYTAALLHDVALPTGAGAGVDFTIGSATVAAQVAEDVGLSASAAEVVTSAITLHESPDVHLDDGPVAYLLSAGAALDVIGSRVWDLPPSAVASVLEGNPRAGFKREFADLWRAEAARVPGGRAQFLQRYAAFSLAIRLAPFRD
jgi:hypothetical protein